MVEGQGLRVIGGCESAGFGGIVGAFGCTGGMTHVDGAGGVAPRVPRGWGRDPRPAQRAPVCLCTASITRRAASSTDAASSPREVAAPVTPTRPMT